ncbi:MAG: hypothetical protein DLM61_12810 [Pseudonocardiales bacterium]|nr:MAG: hypothetical protein DLM61_12810 [Pseudonocardiales bacterium]
MSESHVDLLLVGLAVLARLGVMAAFRSGARGAYKVARQTQEVTRMGGNLGRALGTTVVIVGVQWAVVTFTADPRAWGVALGVPALFAGSVIARMFSVTEIVHSSKGTRR